jgi:integrase
VLAVTTGMRQGELLGLHWRDVDPEREAVSVRAALQCTSGGFALGEPKTARSRRQAALSATAATALHRHRIRQAAERLRAGEDWEDLDLLFPLLERVGLPRIRFHDLRHTAATLMLTQGVHPKVAQEMLGHATIATTLDLYSHATVSMQHDAARALDQLLGG